MSNSSGALRPSTSARALRKLPRGSSSAGKRPRTVGRAKRGTGGLNSNPMRTWAYETMRKQDWRPKEKPKLVTSYDTVWKEDFAGPQRITRKELNVSNRQWYFQEQTKKRIKDTRLLLGMVRTCQCELLMLGSCRLYCIVLPWTQEAKQQEKRKQQLEKARESRERGRSRMARRASGVSSEPSLRRIISVRAAFLEGLY